MLAAVLRLDWKVEWLPAASVMNMLNLLTARSAVKAVHASGHAAQRSNREFVM